MLYAKAPASESGRYIESERCRAEARRYTNDQERHTNENESHSKEAGLYTIETEILTSVIRRRV
jgi:hypothetical protein